MDMDMDTESRSQERSEEVFPHPHFSLEGRLGLGLEAGVSKMSLLFCLFWRRSDFESHGTVLCP